MNDDNMRIVMVMEIRQSLLKPSNIAYCHVTAGKAKLKEGNGHCCVCPFEPDFVRSGAVKCESEH